MNVFKIVLRYPYRLLKKIYKQITYPPMGYVYMLHRVDEWETGKLFPNENMKVTPSSLEQFILKIKDKYSFIRAEEIRPYIESCNKKPFIVFTFDDGYKDNLLNALPIFKKYNIPFTIFFSTCFAEQNAVLWWYELEKLLISNSSITLANGKTYEAKTEQEKCNAFIEIRSEILKLDQKNLIDELNKMFAGYNINWMSSCSELCMSWDDLKEMAKDPLVTIGAHTQHHYNLKQLKTVDDVNNEIISGMKLLQEKGNVKTSIFAYPFGSDNEVGSREFNIAEEIGLNCAFIAYGGDINIRNKKNFYSLPRIMLTEEYIRKVK